MSKTNKIKKKKSFMFTTKHHSFLGVLGCIIAVISLIVVLLNIYIAFLNRGIVSTSLAGMSVFALFSNVIGITCAIISLNEGDIHKYVPVTALIFNICDVIIWVLIILYGR